MNPKDKHYLALQFRYEIYSKNGTEFQSFFEKIMRKAFPRFRKIRPQGKRGDAGNDGYERDGGVYYQAYAPLTPKVSETNAAGKLEKDFQKLKNGWDEISKIKEYDFVFNDKYEGSVQLLEEIITKLELANPGIKFKLFLAEDLERIFMALDEAEILDLGFNIDLRRALDLAYKVLSVVKNELEVEQASFALRTLEHLKEIISVLDDDDLSLEYEILECRCLQRLENIDEARKRYDNLSKRYPHNPQPLLYLAEIYLNDKDFDKNKELLEKAEKIDSNYWLLKLEQLIRGLALGEKIDIANIDNKAFPKDSRERASLYRLYALISEIQRDSSRADSFIEKAIHLTPTRFLNFIDQLWLIELRMFAAENLTQKIALSQELLAKTEEIERRFTDVGDIGARNKANLYIKKLSAFEVQGETQQYENLAKATFDLAIACYFDKRIEHIVTVLLQVVAIPDNDLNKVLDRIRESKTPISDELSQVLITQFSLKNSLFTTGKRFFQEIDNRQYIGVIEDIENINSERILAFLEKNTGFAINLVSSLKVLPELRLKIIEKLPDDKNIPKDKLRLVVYFDEKDFDKAFEILKQLNLSRITYVEGKHFLHIAQQKKAWDLEIEILDKLLEKERDEKGKFGLKVELFTVNLNLKKYTEAIRIGEQLLEEDKNKNFLDQVNKEILLTNTIFACIERGKVDDKAYKKARTIIEKYALAKPSFEYKAGAEAEVYLLNDEVEKARQSIVEGVKIKGTLSPTDYAKLYFIFSIKIGNRVDIKQDSLEKVTNNTFVKLQNKDRWYFVGDGNPLDALPISKSHQKYSSFIDKQIGETANSGNKYRSSRNDEPIELIYSTEQYIFWQTIQTFHQLGSEGDLVGVDMIEVPEKGDSIDPENLLKFLEDLNKRTEPIFELYSQNNIPLAVLAKGEGGLVSAIGHIQKEQKGFVNCSLGTADEFEKQKAVARKVIEDMLPFYLEGTSAMFLSEIGLLPKIYSHIPNLKVPQSVINLLAIITEKFRFEPGQTGYLGYAQGKLTFSTVEKDKRDLLRANFISSINLLESKPQNISVISSANKIAGLSEREMLPELCDASILAQKENIPVLTDDYLYLQMNECSDPKKVDRKVAFAIKLMPLGFEFDRGQILQG